MRDLLNDLDAGRAGFEADFDPVRKAQKEMRQKLPKRFYENVAVEEREGRFAVLLDGRTVRTPGRAELALPTRAAADLVAAEFDRQVEIIDPTDMPVLRLANSAIDGVSTNAEAVLEDILSYAGTDLVCYRADTPSELVELQSRMWNVYTDWARRQLGARFILAEGVMHVAQAPEAIISLRAHLEKRADPFRLSALHVLTTLTGSALIAAALEADGVTSEDAWAAAHLDEDWNIHLWGEDAEAAQRRANRKRDFDAAVALLRALPRGQ
jgi:chaperone required for assembly of F1-ATPase